ncbi:MAG: hypothetical protein HOC70_02740, partial [Gammaproteobacteria bacterium]|nr:hypothetical protein [Gammaproteobacteria bacterium]
MSQILPHLGAALVIASLLLSLIRRLTEPGPLHIAVFVIAFVACLVPLLEYSISHYARVLTGDLAITSLIWLGFISIK